jgi:hypothetical protein
MLAYLDDILEPADADELREKIEKSPEASRLVHRIRASIARMRLASPKVQGQGIGADPNTVAEYLDNTLPADRVPEMERVCLDSDMHLAEVAASHQILALVLGEPARVDQSLRQRVYRLGTLPADGLADDSAAPPAEGVSIGDSLVTGPEVRPVRIDAVAAVRREVLASQVAETVQSSVVGAGVRVDASANGPSRAVERSRPIVPDYLREEPRRYSPASLLAMSLIVGFLVAALGLLWLDRSYGVARLLGLETVESPEEGVGAASVPRTPESGSAAVPVVPVQPAEGNVPQTVVPQGESALVGGEVPQGAVDVGVGDAGVGEAPADLTEVAPSVPMPASGDDAWVADDGFVADNGAPPEGNLEPSASGREDVAEVTVPPVSDGFEPIVPRDVVDAVVRPGEVVRDSEAGPVAGTIESEVNDSELPPAPALVEPEMVGSDAPDAGAVVDAGVADAVSGGPASEQPVDASIASDVSDPGAGEPGPIQVGRVLSHNQVLAYIDDIAGNWYRLREREPIVVGQSLRVMPTYWPQFLLVPYAIQVTAMPGTNLEVLPPVDERTPAFGATRARMVVIPYQQAGGQIALVNGEQRFTVYTGDLNSIVAIQMDSVMPPGLDPTVEPRVPVARVWVLDGNARVAVGDHPAVEVQQGEALVLVERRAGQLVSGMANPDWMDAKGVTTIDRLASAELESRMQQGRPLALVLSEMAEHPKDDWRSLAVRCLASLGSYEPLTQSLRDEMLYSAWHHHFDELQATLQQGPEASQALKDSFRRVYGEQGEELFRMLWGYDSNQLREREAARLVEFLESESVECRVLAFENLRRITGASLLYQPQHPQARRKGPTARWQERLAAGEIVYEKDPEWLPIFPQTAP